MRINKYLSEMGYCSRREADRLIKTGKVTINGEKATLGDQVEEGQIIQVGRKVIGEKPREVLLAFNKPRGVVCTTSRRDKNNIVDYIGYPIRIYPIGRLDQDSEGLILMTNQGELGNQIMRARYEHEKEYIVRVNRDITGEFLRKMQQGVPILDTVTRPCKITLKGRRIFSIILTQGLNRQIRRMCEYFGYEVLRLQRVRIMNIELGDLSMGQYREITSQEKQQLYKMLNARKGEGLP